MLWNSSWKTLNFTCIHFFWSLFLSVSKCTAKLQRFQIRKFFILLSAFKKASETSCDWKRPTFAVHFETLRKKLQKKWMNVTFRVFQDLYHRMYYYSPSYFKKLSNWSTKTERFLIFLSFSNFENDITLRCILRYLEIDFRKNGFM